MQRRRVPHRDLVGIPHETRRRKTDAHTTDDVRTGEHLPDSRAHDHQSSGSKDIRELGIRELRDRA